MKKFSFAKIVTLIFVCATLLCALTVTTAFATDDNTVEIVKTNVFFGETNQLMFAINAPAGAELSASYVDGNEVRNVQVVPFTKNPVKDAEGNYTGEYVDYIVVDGVECKTYILKEGVAAQAIETVITFTVEYEGTVATKDYSVLQYMYERMNVKKNVEGAELNMFNALLAYAEAADIFLDKTPADQTISNYKYVTVVDGTLDGSNTSGMFLLGVTPFANIEAFDYDTAQYKVEWDVSVDGAAAERYTDEEIRTLPVSGAMTITRQLVANECPHTEWRDATCTEAKTCVACGATNGEALGHNIVTDDAKAPTCTETGLTEGSHCTRCDDETVAQNVVDALGHTEVTDDAVSPTCNATGLTEGSHCSVCSEVLVAQKEIDINPDNHNYVQGECTNCGDTKTAKYETYTADFGTLTQNTQYGSRKTANGWQATNAAVLVGGTKDSNPVFKFIGADDNTKAVTLNGKKDACGTLTSPTLKNGISQISFNYGYAFSDTKVNFTVNIKQNGQVIHTETVTENSINQKTSYKYELKLDKPLEGDFIIEIVNNGPSNNTSNKDRLAIWNLTWTSAPIYE